MKRVEQAILIASFVGFSWLAMQAVHELGHIIAAAATGGSVTNVVLHPLEFSRTDVYPNPHPLAVVWAGPLIGIVLPLAALCLALTIRAPGIYLYRFFAGFCLVANGVYVAFGPASGAADPGVMMQLGTPRWLMFVFGAITIPVGLYLWNGLGRHFGFGESRGTVSRAAMITSLTLFIVMIALGILVGK